MFPKSAFITITLAIILVTSLTNGSVIGQEFRDPNVDGIESASSSSPRATKTQGQQKPGSIQGFVPRTTNESLGLIPVRPRTGDKGIGNFRQYRPDYSGARSSAQEQIIEQIRSDSFDLTNPAVTPRQGPQIIRQRYENGKDQLVRHVIQDEQGNFYNHGPWKLYNRNGEVMASGQFIDGAMDGTWERWHSKNSGGMFQTKPFVDFDGPFVSTATFSNGKLNGVWVIADRGRRKIVEVPYKNGKRHGSATWWYPNSERMRVVNFTDGELDGPMLEWNNKNELVRNDEFIHGKKVIRTTTLYRPKQKSAETYYLGAELKLEGEDNWWDAKPAEYAQQGSKLQHGPTFAWYPNGQRKMAGLYRNDVRVGVFTWWHANGQKALAGRYDDGKKNGLWAWWHENGMKSIEGEYADNQPVGEWTWWNAEGSVTQQDDFGAGGNSTGILVTPDDSDTSENESADLDLKELDSAVNESDQTQPSSPPETGIEEMENIRPIETDDPNSESNAAESDSNDGASDSTDRET